MGGKHKQAQRVKNNARPSSSGRSAESLGSFVPQFRGFSNVKEGDLGLSGFSLTFDDMDSSIDTNFQLVLKKMNKKDSVTKLKALQEFTELVKTAELEVIKAILPFWCRLFCSLCGDAEHKVRESTHLAHNQVVLRAKKNLAPFLKQLAGSWFTAQYDTYPPAASAATKAFQDTFSENKIQDAIIFCQEEILLYIYENLTSPVVPTKSTSLPEDVEAKYQRTLISSLHGYTLYLKLVSSEEIEKQQDLNLKIVSHPKFWKLAKNPVPTIKSSWFQLITTLCQKSSLLRHKEAARITGSVFSNLDEGDPIVLLAVWESALAILFTINDWWKYISIEKLLLPKLYKVLKEGGYGNVCTIYPNLLPLISHIFQAVDMTNVANTIFDNMRLGFKSKSVVGSRSESTALATAFVECLQYTIHKNQTDTILCQKLIKSQLFSLLEWGLTDSQAPAKVLFKQSAVLIQYLSRNSNNQEFSNYALYVEYFWNTLQAMFEGLLLNVEYANNSNLLVALIERQIELLLSLKCTTKPKKQLKVTFSSDKHLDNVHLPTDKPNQLDQTQHKYLDSLNNISCKVCKNIVKLVEKRSSKELLNYLVNMVQEFDSESFIHYLNLEFESASNGNSLMMFYRSYLIKWVRDETMCCKQVIDLVFLMFKYLRKDEKNEILNDLINEPECLGWCIAYAFSYPHTLDIELQDWLHREEISKFLVAVAEKELMNECTPQLSLLLKQAFTENLDGELFISKQAALDIIHLLSKSLNEPLKYSTSIDMCARLSSYISAILYTTHFKLHYGDELFLAMFYFLNFFSIDSEFLSDDTRWEVKTAWQDAAYILASELDLEEFKRLVLKLGDILEKIIFDNTFDSKQTIDLIISFMKCLRMRSPLRISVALDLLLNREFIQNWEDSLSDVCIKAEFIKGNICSPYKPLRGNTEGCINECDILNYFTWIDLIAKVISEEEHDDNDDEDDDDNQDVIPSKLVTLLDNVEDLIVHLCYAMALGESFNRCFQCCEPSQSIGPKLNSIQNHFRELVKIMDRHVTEKIEDTLVEKALTNHYLWIKTVYIFYFETIASNDLQVKFIQLLAKLDMHDDFLLSRLQLVQAFAKHITYDCIWDKLSLTESVIVLRSVMFLQELDVPIAEAFSKINDAQKKHGYLTCENTSLQSLSWHEVETIVETARFYSSVLKNKSSLVLPNRLDTILVSFCLWSTVLAKNKSRFKELQVSSFMSSISDLFIAVKQYLEKCDNKHIIDEWQNVFAQDIHLNFMEIWLQISEYYEDGTNKLSNAHLPLLQAFGSTILHFDHAYLFKNKHESLPRLSKILKRCNSLLTHSSISIQLWGYHMLMVLLPGFVEVDFEAINTDVVHNKRLILEQFKPVLSHTQSVVQSMLMDFRLGEDSCVVEPFTDSYTYTFAYFLIWDVLLTLCEKSPMELCYQYADWLKNEGFLNNLLTYAFKLMPLEILHLNVGRPKQYKEWFTTKFSASLNDTCTSEKIEHMVCWVYMSALSQLSPLVRQWWNQIEPRVSQIVERVTSTFVSPYVCQQELAHIMQHDSKFKNMVIKVFPSVREVLAIYTIDEAQMELQIQLPSNYPLRGPVVQCNKQIHGTLHRQWLKQLMLCVQHKNGRIWDGLTLWNSNLDKKFDGVEECCICFAVLHQGTYQLPKLTCQTCKKRFHSACLYKWFSTSNKSTCPICRNLF